MDETLTTAENIDKPAFSKDFILVIIGQIISLFGNQILRFALPLYLLNQTGSAALFGTISACAFIPMIILCPIGGIIADRVNKRNIMVILDFSTAILTIVLSVLLGKVNIIPLLLVGMILLYGIQGTYQPAVQASIPALVSGDNIMRANAAINLVSSLSTLLGPVLGGILFSLFGIMPILYVSIGCFFISAIMEIFIKIPFVKRKSDGNIFKTGFNDLKVSFHYICHDQKCVYKISLLIAAINLVLSASIMIGLPIIITQKLGFDPVTANKFYGYAEGATAIGSLIGGLLAGILSKKLKASHSPMLLFITGIMVVPIGLALNFNINSTAAYVVILISCMVMMAFVSIFSIQMMAYLQILVPENIIGKVISCAMCIGMCATPLGQALYGGLFQWLSDKTFIIFYVDAAIMTALCLITKHTFYELDKIIENRC